MSLVKEFKEFAMRGNVVDLAVGIIIGGAFGKIVSSVVADVLMPPIGLLLGGVKFTDLKIFLTDPVVDAAGVITKQAVSINYGNFVQALVDFLIIAFAIFMMIKGMNSMKKKEVAQPVEAPPPPPPSKEEILLAEIRDILKNK
ncbi:MAG: large-conductance mechanosensitive channel protein MscL [Prolixibacteraceae bacterium]|jgi:large conductance mechanosensitive channel|nr:large-conductance mechanosensitive channel protein MscL [Prolixibacteraceae bacterium]